MNDKNKPNIFNRIITVVLMILITVLIISSFLNTSKFKITYEILVCLSLLAVLCLSENFDNLSIPKILELSKNLKKEKMENIKLRDNYIKLANQIVNNNNMQVNCYPTSITAIGTKEIENVNNNEIEEETMDRYKITPKDQLFINTLTKYKRYINIIILKKYFKESLNNDITYDVKVQSNGETDNIIRDRLVTFNALEVTDFASIFYQVQQLFLFDNTNIYYQLKLVEMYGVLKNTNAKLVFLIPDLDKELKEILFPYNFDYYEKIKPLEYEFEPAIKNGLFEIQKVFVTKEELDEYEDDSKNITEM